MILLSMEDQDYMMMDCRSESDTGHHMSRESLGGSSSVSGGLSWRPDTYLDSDPVNLYSITKTDPDTSISSSLPNTHVLDTCVTTPSLHVSHESSEAVTVSPGTEVHSVVTSSTSCVSLHRSQSHSPVSRFSKLLRNSFSKLRA